MFQRRQYFVYYFGEISKTENIKYIKYSFVSGKQCMCITVIQITYPLRKFKRLKCLVFKSSLNNKTFGITLKENLKYFPVVFIESILEDSLLLC